MKQLLIILSIAATIILSGEHAQHTINVSQDMQMGNYYNYNDSAGTPAIDRTIIFDRRVKIQSINIVPAKKSYMEINYMDRFPDISLNGKEFYRQCPNSHVSSINTGYMNTSTIVSFTLFPLIDVKTGQYIEEFSVSIIYDELASEKFKSQYDFFIDLPNSILDSKTGEMDNMETSLIDQVIITREEYTHIFDDFIRTQNLMGIITVIKPIEEIYKEHSGTDEQESIRNYIIEMYHGYGIRMVLIGGDADIVPIRKAYNSSYYYYGYVPTDAYYADIDGTWNADRDTIIGELAADSIDGYPDLAVSRIPFDNATELIVYLDKIKTYLFDQNTDNLDRFLLSGSSILESLKDGIGQRYSDYIKTMTNTHAYAFTTQYSPIQDTFNDNAIWQAGDMGLNVNSFISGMSDGYYLINHIDHSHESWLGTGMYETGTAMFMSDVNRINNHSGTMSIMFSMGCTTNPIDRESAAEELTIYANSSIISYTGFSRTGWTSSQRLMNDFWNKMADNETRYFYEAYMYAMNTSYLYFRVAINNNGIPALPVYHKQIKPLYAILPDTVKSGEKITVNVHNGTYNMENASVVLMDSKHYIRGITDLGGNVEFEHDFSDSVIYVGIFRTSSKLILDTIFVEMLPELNIAGMHIDSTFTKLNYTVFNNTNSTLNNVNIHLLINDSLLDVNSQQVIANIYPHDSLQCSAYIDYYKSPMYKCSKDIQIAALYSDKNIQTYASVKLMPDSFIIAGFYEKNIKKIQIDSIIIVNASENYINARIKISADSCELDNDSFRIEMTPFDTIYLTDISSRILPQYDSLSYWIDIMANNRNKEIHLNRYFKDEILLKASYSSDGVELYHDYNDCNMEIFKLDTGTGQFNSLTMLNNNIFLYTDASIQSNQSTYYGIAYDGAGRIIDITDTVSVNTFFQFKKASVQTGGSFYGRLGNNRYYVKSSMNYGDMDCNGVEDIVIVGDDGKVLILDHNMNEISNKEYQTGKLHETTPSIANIDNNTYPDIVIGHGVSSDTTAMIIFNPMSENDSAVYITGYGSMMASPCVYDINNDGSKNLILGTTSGFFVFDANMNELSQYTRRYRNITAVSVSMRDSALIFSDYYGKIYALDSNGAMLPGFPFNTGEVILAPFVNADLNNDGKTDIIAATASGSIFSININGLLNTGFPYKAAYPIYQSPKISDYNNDYSQEISFLDLRGNLTSIDHSGAVIFKYSTNEKDNNTYNEPIIADLNNDNVPEIIIGTRSGKIHIIDFAGNVIKPGISITGEITSSPLLIMPISENPSLIVRTSEGNIFKCTYLEGFVRSADARYTMKTLIDQQNTSCVDMHLISSKKLIDYSNAEMITSSVFKLRHSIVNEMLLIDNAGIEKDKSAFSIIDKTGRTVYTHTAMINTPTQQLNLKAIGLPSGIYFINPPKSIENEKMIKFTYIK